MDGVGELRRSLSGLGTGCPYRDSLRHGRREGRPAGRGGNSDIRQRQGQQSVPAPEQAAEQGPEDGVGERRAEQRW